MLKQDMADLKAILASISQRLEDLTKPFLPAKTLEETNSAAGQTPTEPHLNPNTYPNTNPNAETTNQDHQALNPNTDIHLNTDSNSTHTIQQPWDRDRLLRK
ncbi:MAG: hypothetical protein Q8881_02555, partial [Sweet potato little leaf phytoplasma]|nr:hypothetical protein [Sweet potato little leaf phytoplasma]